MVARALWLACVSSGSLHWAALFDLSARLLGGAGCWLGLLLAYACGLYATRCGQDPVVHNASVARQLASGVSVAANGSHPLRRAIGQSLGCECLCLWRQGLGGPASCSISWLCGDIHESLDVVLTELGHILLWILCEPLCCNYIFLHSFVTPHGAHLDCLFVVVCWVDALPVVISLASFVVLLWFFATGGFGRPTLCCLLFPTVGFVFGWLLLAVTFGFFAWHLRNHASTWIGSS